MTIVSTDNSLGLVNLGVLSGGIPNQECLILEVIWPLDLSQFQVINAEFAPNGQLSLPVKDLFWFPQKTVAAGDFIMLYSRPGAPSEIPDQHGRGMNHLFYWGKDRTIWNKPNSAAVVVRTDGWVASGLIDQQDMDRLQKQRLFWSHGRPQGEPKGPFG